uniref:Ocellatin-P1 n=1 Tax=Leptodactylus pentadactylus TaxID=47564 RepID=OCE1_LEPPE|nr:RecName: Full=Ocellatin-P1; AltName: Full=Pentadactylin [Leptodactylus pentadactylus]
GLLDTLKGAAKNVVGSLASKVMEKL